jgi:DNA-binding response OmpR family regulator
MKILLLEDDIALNKSIYDALIYSGYSVDTFFDGNDVINNLNSIYDLYIMDINVPNISGLELLDLIQNQTNQSKIIMISSNTDINIIENAYNLGCIDYLKKPFHLKELRIKIDKLFSTTNSLLEELKVKPDSNLSKKERRFLELLLKNKDLVTTYQMIDEFVYEDKTMSMDALRALVRRLRTKLEEDIIKNISDVGYSVK